MTDTLRWQNKIFKAWLLPDERALVGTRFFIFNDIPEKSLKQFWEQKSLSINKYVTVSPYPNRRSPSHLFLESEISYRYKTATYPTYSTLHVDLRLTLIFNFSYIIKLFKFIRDLFKHVSGSNRIIYLLTINYASMSESRAMDEVSASRLSSRKKIQRFILILLRLWYNVRFNKKITILYRYNLFKGFYFISHYLLCFDYILRRE